MKIAFLNKYQNKVFRGAETFIYELSRRLSKNHQVDVISNINYFELLKKRYDIVIPTNGRLQAFIVRKITWLTGKKMIISGQSGKGFDDRLNLYAFPDIFVTISTKALNWAKKVNPFVKSVYIPNGVDLEKFHPATKKENNRTVLCVGAFSKEKRIDLAIKAAAKLDGVNLIVAGGGGDRKKKIEKLGHDLLGGRFRIMSVPFEKMPEVYRMADVFTLPSWTHESFGNVIVEAMATNLPVVTTDDPIRREIVGDAGILVDPTNIEEYAKALQKGLDAAWGDKPRRQAEKFSWDKIAEEYEELFNKLK